MIGFSSSTRFSQPRHHWSGSLHRMAKFSSYCESMLQRRSREEERDRGHRYYKASRHHLHTMFLRWDRQVRVQIMARLLKVWYLRSVLQHWATRVQTLNANQEKMHRMLQLWNNARIHAGFQTWKRRTNTEAALNVLATAVRLSWLRTALLYWRHKHRLLRWRSHVFHRCFQTWRKHVFDTTTMRHVLQQMLHRFRLRTSRNAFGKWYLQYVRLQEIWSKHNQYTGTSLDRLFQRRQIRRGFRAWYNRAKELTNAFLKIHQMNQNLERYSLKSAWNAWRRSMFTWGRKRRQACGCAKALAKSRKGLGWCYKCSSLTHLQNRIEDSVELIEGMSLRLAKTALATKNQSTKAKARNKSMPRWRRRKKRAAGEVALDNVLRLLHVDRYSSNSNGRVSLRTVDDTSTIDQNNHVVSGNDDAENEIEMKKDTCIDLETSIGLQSLTLKSDNGNVKRSFVSKSARDSFERLSYQHAIAESVVEHNTNTTEGTPIALPVEQDGLEGGKSNSW